MQRLILSLMSVAITRLLAKQNAQACTILGALAARRDATHKGAQCIACKHHAEAKGIELKPGGSCLAEIQAILAHVRNCKHQSQATKAEAGAVLKALRSKRAAQSGDTNGSSGSNKSVSASKQLGLQNFMAQKDRPLSTDEQKRFEQHCLKGTISANLPFTCWDDEEFRQIFTSVRPSIKSPTRRTMSGRILDQGAAAAWEVLSQTLRESDGKLTAHTCINAM